MSDRRPRPADLARGADLDDFLAIDHRASDAQERYLAFLRAWPGSALATRALACLEELDAMAAVVDDRRLARTLRRALEARRDQRERLTRWDPGPVVRLD